MASMEFRVEKCEAVDGVNLEFREDKAFLN